MSGYFYFAIATGLSLYLLPSIIAWARHAQNRWSISAVNCFLGWTVVGWIVAIIWALREGRVEQ